MKHKAELAGVELGADIIPWPDGVAKVTNISNVTLQRSRAAGDAPRLYAISERNLVTTRADLLEWVCAKVVPPGYKCRPPVRRGRIAA